MDSHAGAKSYMRFDDQTLCRVREELLRSDASSVIASLKQMGLSKEEALTLIETYWEGGIQ